MLAGCGPDAVIASSGGSAEGGATGGTTAGSADDTTVTSLEPESSSAADDSGSSGRPSSSSDTGPGGEESSGASTVCGDGRVEGEEACDDGNRDVNDACLNTCELATCGDGFLFVGQESCDDGNDRDGDGCESSCVPTGTLWHNRLDRPRAVTVDLDDNVLVAGAVEHSLQDTDVWVGKYSGDGDELWTRTFAGVAGGHDGANDVAVDTQGGVYIAGSIYETSLGPYVVALASDGGLRWSGSWAPGLLGQATAVDVGVDGSAWVVGWTEEMAFTPQPWLRQYSVDGALLSSSSPRGDGFMPRSIAVDDEGTIAIVGISTGGLVGGWIEVLDGQAQSLWHAVLDGGDAPAERRVNAVIGVGDAFVAVGQASPAGAPAERAPQIWCFDAVGFVDCDLGRIELGGVGVAMGTGRSAANDLAVVGVLEEPLASGWLRVFEARPGGGAPSSAVAFPFTSAARGVAFDSEGAAVVVGSNAVWKVAAF